MLPIKTTSTNEIQCKINDSPAVELKLQQPTQPSNFPRHSISAHDQNQPILIKRENSLSFENTTINSFIQTTFKAELTAVSCTFTPKTFPQLFGLELRVNSKATFRNCIFSGFEKAAVVLEHKSQAEFINCTFMNNKESSVFVSSESSSEFSNCTFENCQKYPLFLNNKGSATIRHSKFKNSGKAAIFLLNSSTLTGLRNEFDMSQSGIILSNHSLVILSHSTFSNIVRSSIHACDESEVSISKCNFSHIGNGLKLDNSKGSLKNSHIQDVTRHGVIIVGSNSDPLLSENIIDNCGGFNVFVSDYATPKIISSTFRNQANYNLSISNQAMPLIAHNKIIGNTSAIFVLNDASPVILKNDITSPNTVEAVVWGLPFYIQSENSSVPPHFQQSKHGQIDIFHLPNDSIVSEIETVKGKFRITFSEDYKNVEYHIPKIEEIERSTERMSHCPHSNLCQKCHKNVATHVITPCGHNAFCESCAGSIQCKVDKCPICNDIISSLGKIYESQDNICAVCLDSKCDSIFLPCGHKCCCKECASKAHKITKRCPFCNQSIFGAQKIYCFD